MFCTYDYSEFPIVKVIFDGMIHDESEFTLFTEQWLKLYEDKKEFTFLFDVKYMSMVNPYWCYKIASFIGEIKKQPTQYLQRSTIINTNQFIMYLLRIVFSIQSPISPVTIISNDGTEVLINP